MPEFTGERVIPGLVDDDLFNEHLARYRFAARYLAAGPGQQRVLDAACGSGYGAGELAQAASQISVVSVDVSAEATTLARQHSAAVVQASCEALPFAAESFDLIAAFEMIEHLQDAGRFLAEARRILRPHGVLLVSTPNRNYYAESRAAAGPNPFHTREFDYQEFSAALSGAFPHIRIWTQNHAAAIVLATTGQTTPVLESGQNPKPEDAHFFLAACSRAPLAETRSFAWIPDSGNVLSERERHIARLGAELRQKDQWLAELHASHAALQAAHASTEAELRERNLWAESLNRKLTEAARLVESLEQQAEARLNWVWAVESDLARARAHIDSLEQTVSERTLWAKSLEAEKNRVISVYRELEAGSQASLQEVAAALAAAAERHSRLLRLVATSRWVRLGRRFNMGPVLPPPDAAS